MFTSIQCVSITSPPNPLEGGLSCQALLPMQLLLPEERFWCLSHKPSTAHTGDAQNLPCQAVPVLQELNSNTPTPPRATDSWVQAPLSYITPWIHLHLGYVPSCSHSSWLFVLLEQESQLSTSCPSAVPLPMFPFCSWPFPLCCPHQLWGLSAWEHTSPKAPASTKLQSSLIKMWLGMNNSWVAPSPSWSVDEPALSRGQC